MPNGVMLEASMLLHRDSANYLLALARTSGSLDAGVSGALLDIASSKPESLARLARFLEIPSDALLDVASLEEFAQEISPKVQAYQMNQAAKAHSIREPELFRVTLEHFTKDGLIAQILYEEWHFMASQSWIFSKTRRAFDSMVEAGGTAIQMSHRAFDLLVRRTLKEKPNEPLTSCNRLRAAAKWIAVGGPAILSTIEPISAAIASASSGFFLLVDP